MDDFLEIIAESLDRMTADRGSKLNVLGPRGGAKSTLATLAYPLREALLGREPYIWLISDTAHQAAAHLENIKLELLDNPIIVRANRPTLLVCDDLQNDRHMESSLQRNHARTWFHGALLVAVVRNDSRVGLPRACPVAVVRNDSRVGLPRACPVAVVRNDSRVGLPRGAPALRHNPYVTKRGARRTRLSE